jgi:hypothetical protein
MLGLLAYVRYVERPSHVRMVWVASSLILAALAKPMVVSFPLALLLLDFWPLRRLGSSTAEMRAQAWPLIKEKMSLFLICAATALGTIFSQAKTGSLDTVFPWYLKLARIIDNVGFYCRTFFAPNRLSILYRVEKLDYMNVVLVGLAVVVISIFVLRRRWPWLFVGWYWFLLTLAPVAGFIRIGHVTVADRYSYLPSVGLAVAVVYSIEEVVVLWPRVRGAMAGGLVCCILLCVLGTWVDLPRWQNTFSVFESASRNGGHYIACRTLGAMLFAQREYQQSIVVCTRGLEAEPSGPLYSARGEDYYMLGDLDSALRDFNSALEVEPAFAPTYYDLARVHAQRKQFIEAREDVRRYLQNGGQLDTSVLNIPPQ